MEIIVINMSNIPILKTTTPADNELRRLIDATLRFEYISGAVTSIAHPHSTGHRILPCALCVQLIGDSVMIELPDDEALVVRSGEAFVIPEGTPHRITLVKGGKGVSRWAHFNVSVFETVDALAFYQTPRVVKGDVAQELGDLCEELAEASSRKDLTIESQTVVMALGFRLAAVIFHYSHPTRDLRGGAATFQWLSPLLRRLKDGRSKKVPLRRMAKMAGLSISRFSALFHKTMGESPVRYQTRMRLLRAKILLLRTDNSAAEIAEELGYKDQFHFSKAFKKECGTSPRNYRSQSRMTNNNTGF